MRAFFTGHLFESSDSVQVPTQSPSPSLVVHSPRVGGYTRLQFNALGDCSLGGENAAGNREDTWRN